MKAGSWILLVAFIGATAFAENSRAVRPGIVLPPATVDNNASCDIGTFPAATLLLPYFEVEARKHVNDAGNTIFSVINTSRQPQIARVTIWTDYGYPALWFNLFLTGYGVSSISLYDVIANGKLPETSSSARVGSRSRPNNANPNIVSLDDCTALGGPLPQTTVDSLIALLTSGTAEGECHYGGAHPMAVGYVTIDVVNSCSKISPLDPAYYAKTLLFDNVLTGDYERVVPDKSIGNYAGGNPLVHTRATPGGGPGGGRHAGPPVPVLRREAAGGGAPHRPPPAAAVDVRRALHRGRHRSLPHGVHDVARGRDLGRGRLRRRERERAVRLDRALRRVREPDRRLRRARVPRRGRGGDDVERLPAARRRQRLRLDVPRARHPRRREGVEPVLRAAPEPELDRDQDAGGGAVRRGVRRDVDWERMHESDGADRSIQMKRALAVIALLVAIEAPAATRTIATANAASCDIGTYAAATLLLPYFEVEYDQPQNEGLNTIFTVINTSAAPQIVRVTIWTDWGYPATYFSMFLTGYDAHTISMYDILARGNYPTTSSMVPVGANSASSNPHFYSEI